MAETKMTRVVLNTKIVSKENQNIAFGDVNDDFDPAEVMKIQLRVTFLRLGEIDTLNERYQAHIAFEARWLVQQQSFMKAISHEDQLVLKDGRSIVIENFRDTHWHPQLFIENALGEIKESFTYTARRLAQAAQIEICEHRDVKGLFWEKLELYHFPTDVQELSISIGSLFYDDKVILIPDPIRSSGINRETFVDQQEWFLYEHVNTSQRFVKEIVMQDEKDTETYSAAKDARKTSFFTVCCHAARQSEYYFWNGFCLMFLITICGFCIFSIPPTLPQNRLQIGVTLLLTSITFRWTVNRSLPTISYLTAMDKYSIISIFILVILCIWYAVIGTVVFATKNYPTVDTDNFYVWIDRYIFFGLVGLFIILHGLMLFWLFKVPLAYRKKMHQNDIEYQKEKARKASMLKANFKANFGI